jgi:drug/metabolite transporter (DMT)-like permease
VPPHDAARAGPSAAPAARGAWRLAALTAVTLLFFAANSLLCRAALGPAHIDAPTFTAVRIASGAAMLSALAWAGRSRPRGGSWGSAAALFGYALAFSLAYVRIGAAVGALLLFPAVQITMTAWALRRGARLRARQWAGNGVALAGLALLAAPGAHRPDVAGAALMVLAGVSWGVYSLRGAGAGTPLEATGDNFVRALPLAAAALLVAGARPLSATGEGLALAAASGAIASGVGYALWYAALPALGAARAASAQLATPVLAAAGGVVLLGEAPTLRLLASGVAILGGVALAARR